MLFENFPFSSVSKFVFTIFMDNLTIAIVVVIVIILVLISINYLYSPDWASPNLAGKVESPPQPTAKVTQGFSSNVFGLKYPKRQNFRPL